ncbi:hypothetical protein [Tropicimonas marinistellae]|uniref:hypothetical protein n=1 Tax=Tropicimonas marinistellae TaxID=1739787 RepID=UPI00083639BE|nr:hypothetical protein [Tropicimonas marinistellae]
MTETAAEDFALIDFAISARPLAEVAAALGRVRDTPAGGSDAPGDGSAGSPRRGNLLSRVFGRSSSKGWNGRTTGGNLLIQPDGTLGPPPLTRPVLTDMGFGVTHSPVRLSAPLGVAGLTMIEFREGDGDVSTFCQRLSSALDGDEVFYFRYSGSRHPGAHFAFHVYQHGRVSRRAVSRSLHGTAPEADWQGIDSGIPHPLETDSLPAPGTPNSEIMTPVRQASIIEALGIDPETLFFEASEQHVTLELSDARGGLPLSSAETIIAEKRRKPPDAPVREDRSPPPDKDDSETVSATEASPPQDLPRSTRSWEEEVTHLLVEAVDSALPPEEQVAWLDSLTARLEAGDVDSALADACRIIDAGNRPLAEKQAAADRLIELFGRSA